MTEISFTNEISITNMISPETSARYSIDTADSKTGEKQSLRKVDETLIVDFNFLTVLQFL